MEEIWLVVPGTAARSQRESALSLALGLWDLGKGRLPNRLTGKRNM